MPRPPRAPSASAASAASADDSVHDNLHDSVEEMTAPRAVSSQAAASRAANGKAPPPAPQASAPGGAPSKPRKKRSATDASRAAASTAEAEAAHAVVSTSEDARGGLTGGDCPHPDEARLSDFDRLFREWSRTGDPRLRERLILMNRNLVTYIARKFLDRGEMSEDIIQQGLIGLINALDHFDPAHGVRFATFATPTIMGEIRRYFRDKAWGIRVPRRLQELNQTINNKIEGLTQELDRSPTYAEIARALNLRLEDVVEALEMPHAMEPLSMDEEIAFGSDRTPTAVGDQLGAVDVEIEGWGDHAALQSALQQLPEKERRVLELAYFQEHSQVEIARLMQVSQMFVSRLQRRALAHLRELMNSQSD